MAERARQTRLVLLFLAAEDAVHQLRRGGEAVDEEDDARGTKRAGQVERKSQRYHDAVHVEHDLVGDDYRLVAPLLPLRLGRVVVVALRRWLGGQR